MEPLVDACDVHFPTEVPFLESVSTNSILDLLMVVFCENIMGLIHYSYAHITLFNFPCALGSQPCHLLFANGAGGVE